MLSALALFSITLAAGYFARRFERFSDESADVLNRFVIDVCVPATILRLVPELRFSAELSLLAIVPWLAAGVAYVVTRAIGNVLKLDLKTRTVLFLCTAMGNTSFLGFPLCSALLGQEAVPLAAVYDQLGSFLLLSTVGVWSVARASGDRAPSLREMLRRVAAFPPFLALLVALLPWTHPVWLDDVFAKIGAALVPVAMFGVGLRTRLTPPENGKVFALGLGLKLVVMPLLALAFSAAVGTTREVRDVLVLETGMPSMITVGALAMAHGIAPRLAAALVGWGVVFAMFTAPAWAYLLRGG